MASENAKTVKHTRHAGLEAGRYHLHRPGFGAKRPDDLSHGGEETLESQKNIGFYTINRRMKDKQKK